MKIIFRNKKITGICCVLPEIEVFFDDEVNNYSFSLNQTMRLKKVMGYDKHRIVKPSTASSDLCVFGVQKLIDERKLKSEDVCAILAVTITPDYFVPHVSNIVQGKCGFSQDVFCLDILQGCCGFLVGLAQAFMILDYNPGKKVLLLNTDTLSKKVSKQDRNSYPLTGDCAAITIIENSDKDNELYFNIYMDGSRGGALIIPAGGSRLACGPETATMKDDGSGNFRSLDNFSMDGEAVFQFVMADVPPMLQESFEFANITHDQIDWYIFHQPNRFMLQKLAQKSNISPEKMFMNIVENFGNPSGASIPLTATANLGSDLLNNTYTCCLGAFGSGLSYGALIMELGELDYCETCISDF